MDVGDETKLDLEVQSARFDSNETSPGEIISKRAKKRLAKKQKWEMNKKAMREKERQRKKMKRILLREKGETAENPTSRKRLKGAMTNSSCRQRVSIDISFDHLMDDRDISKTCKQVQRCYASNRRASSPLQLYVTSCCGKTRDRLFSTEGTQHWDIHFRAGGYLEEFRNEDIIYLTSDSDCVLESLDDSKVYIIGGLVDHNKHKGVCLAQAQQNNISHARLPIDEYIDMKTRKVLAINHVFEIMLRVAEGLTWKDAFMNTLAPRKGAIPKEEKTSEDNLTVTENVEESCNS